jgi:protein NRD1
VGFGPRDCSDYTTGISIVPISRLTDADRKWVVTAEYGGTGGRPLEAGMIIEEPDIEIGAGVSSKAISQKIHLRPRQDGGAGRGRGRGRGQDWNQPPRDEGYGQQGGGGGGNTGVPMGFPPFPMMGQGQQGMFPQGQYPPFMMPPQMQAFFQQQFGGGQGQQGGQEGFSGGYGEQQGNEGRQ